MIHCCELSAAQPIILINNNVIYIYYPTRNTWAFRNLQKRISACVINVSAQTTSKLFYRKIISSQPLTPVSPLAISIWVIFSSQLFVIQSTLQSSADAFMRNCQIIWYIILSPLIPLSKCSWTIKGKLSWWRRRPLCFRIQLIRGHRIGQFQFKLEDAWRFQLGTFWLVGAKVIILYLLELKGIFIKG